MEPLKKFSEFFKETGIPPLLALVDPELLDIIHEGYCNVKEEAEKDAVRTMGVLRRCDWSNAVKKTAQKIKDHIESTMPKTKKTLEEMEIYMEEIFRPIDDKVRGFSGFNQGHSMQSVARNVAPVWLRKWDDNHRWLICFVQGWSGLIVMAKAFGWTKERLLNDLIYYESHFGENE